jgi:alpha-1,2-mannosyltransferase
VTVTLGVAAVGAALWAARRYEAHGEELLGLSVIGMAGLLASPISWTHHWVWTVPALVALVAAARIDRLHTDPLRIGLAVIGAACFIDVYRGGAALPHPLHPEWPAVFTVTWQQMCGASYVVAGVGYLAWAVARARRRHGRHTPSWTSARGTRTSVP